jgi:hypothetical protein
MLKFWSTSLKEQHMNTVRIGFVIAVICALTFVTTNEELMWRSRPACRAYPLEPVGIIGIYARLHQRPTPLVLTIRPPDAHRIRAVTDAPFTVADPFS